MEAHLKRPLRTWEHVHHINGDGQDDRIENLQLVTIWEHGSIHSGKIPDEVLLEALRQLAKELGRAPTKRECTRSPLTPHGDTYCVRFGSWANALRAAGIDLGASKPGYLNTLIYRTAPDSVLLEALRNLASRLGKPPTGEDIDKDPRTPSSRTYWERFGGVPAARRRAGIA